MLLGRKKLYRFSWSTIGKNLKKCYEKVCLLWSFPKARLKHWCWHLKYIIKECNPSCTPWFWNIFSIFSGGKYFIFYFYCLHTYNIHDRFIHIYAAHIYWMKSNVSSKYMYVVEVEQRRIFFINEFIVDVVMWN